MSIWPMFVDLENWRMGTDNAGKLPLKPLRPKSLNGPNTPRMMEEPKDDHIHLPRWPDSGL